MLTFENRVVVITGAGAGLGLQYAHFFAQRKANIVLNDFAKKDGKWVAEIVASELSTKYGAKVVANNDSVEFGDKIIATAIQHFGRIDVLINNAGILRDKSFTKMTDDEWDIILKIHLTGSYKCTKAAWEYFKKQKYGRIVNTSSGSGLFGNFGQTNYSTAKSGVVGFTKTLAREGANYNIKVNALVPVAATNMTHGNLSPEMLEAVDSKYLIPLVGVLAHEKCPDSGKIYESAAGWIAEIRYQRAKGAFHNLDFTAEDVLKRWNEVTDFSNEPQYPQDLVDSFENIISNYERQKSQKTEQEKPQSNLSGKWKSEEIYQLMKAVIEQGLAGDAVKKCNASYQIDITEKKGGEPVFRFYIVVKQEGQSAGVGELKDADATFVMTDEDFYQMCHGKLNPQMAYIRRKMKIKGNFKKASAFTPDLFPKPTKENIEKFSKSSGVKL